MEEYLLTPKICPHTALAYCCQRSSPCPPRAAGGNRQTSWCRTRRARVRRCPRCRSDPPEGFAAPLLAAVAAVGGAGWSEREERKE